MTTLSSNQEQEIRNLYYVEFGETEPTKDQISKFLEKVIAPRNDGGASLIIAIAALVFQIGTRIIDDRRRRESLKPPPPNIPSITPLLEPPICPVEDCGAPSVPAIEPNEYICLKGHIWIIKE